MSQYWISSPLEPYTIDSIAGGGITAYGSGFLLKLDSGGDVSSLGADFYWENDSLYQGGEPGMSIRFGKWQRNEEYLILHQKLLDKTIMLTSDRIGQMEIDSIRIQGDTILIRKRDTLVVLRKPSIQLQEFLNSVISYHLRK